MFAILRKITVGLFILFLSAGIMWAADAGSLQGTVTDASGRPIKGAEVRVSGKDENVIAKCQTDARGHYASQPFAVGAYKVDLVIKSVIQASIPNVKTRSGKMTQANFDLKLSQGTPKQKRFVAVYHTGSHVPTYVEVDDSGNPKGAVEMNNVSKGDAFTLQRMQDKTAGAMPQSAGR